MLESVEGLVVDRGFHYRAGYYLAVVFFDQLSVRLESHIVVSYEHLVGAQILFVHFGKVSKEVICGGVAASILYIPRAEEHIPLDENPTSSIFSQKLEQVAGVDNAVLIPVQQLKNQEVDFPERCLVENVLDLRNELPVEHR